MANILYKNADKTVNTIAERNAISPKLDDMEVIVLDAIADIEAGPGAAVYKWSESINAWIMLANSKDEPLTSLSFSNDTLTYVDENGTSTDIDLSIYEHADPTILKSADIGVSVQAYSADTVIDANYVHTDNNYTTTEKNKLAGIEDGATADQTKADIDALGIAASTSDTLSTPRSFKIGNTSRTFDGSSNVIWTEEDINSQKYGGVYKYQKIYSVTETTPLKIVDRLDAPVTNGTLRVKAQIPGTGTTNTAGSAIFYYNNGVWNVHKSSLSGESSNRVDFFIDVDGDPAVKTWHSSTYSVYVNHEYVQRAGNFVPGFWGIDGELESISGALSYNNDRVFTESYHPNANVLTTPREIALTGDASGSVEFDGSGDVSIDVTVANDSHTHDTQYYTKSEIDNIEQVLQTSISDRPTFAETGLNENEANYLAVANCASSAVVDWDNITTPGMYNRVTDSGSVNGPPGWTYYYVQVFSYANRVTQLAIPYGIASHSGRIAYRTYVPGESWRAWSLLYDTNNKPSASDVGAYTTAQVDAIESGLQVQVDDQPTYTEVGLINGNTDYKAVGLIDGINAAVDWDTLTNAGVYHILASSGSTNGPATNSPYYYVHVYKYNNSAENLTQFAIPYGTSSTQSHMAYRTRFNGIWHPWSILYSTDNVPTPADIGTYSSSEIDTIESGLQSQINDKLDSLVGVKGDMYVHNGTSFVKLNAGLDGQILYADSSEPTGLKWDYPTIG